jgi:AcrR family transcriptional regulator
MPRMGLDAARVVEAAAGIADAEGLDTVTLARVAGDLGVRAPSLYNHVDGRGDLMRAIAVLGVRELTAALREAAVGRSGADALTAAANAYRAYARAHPGRYAATVAAPARDDAGHTAAASEAVDVLLAVMRGWDLEGDDAIHAVRAFRSAVHGFAAIEAAGGFGMDVDVDASFDRLVATLAGGLGEPGPGLDGVRRQIVS